MATLLTWVDRPGRALAHHGKRPDADRGPIMRLLEQDESRSRYDQAVVLATAAVAERARELVGELSEHVANVQLRTLAVTDPSSFDQLFSAVLPVVDSLPQGEVDVILSAGTPQAQALWVILVQAGILDARMLQVIPEEFVGVSHDGALREVRLDIDGFPQIRALKAELSQLRAASLGIAGMVGVSAPMHRLVRRIARVAPTELPVLVVGETGTGKEGTARALHDQSERRAGPFIAESCGVFTDSVLQSELFGHERGAFTGAERARRGLFEQANGGTLFLDEVGEMSARVQAALLRVLEDGTLRRVGGEQSVRVDVRVIAATHRDLALEVAEGRFRQDLYYRLHGATLEVPKLRERIVDLEPLVATFLAERGAKLRVTRAAFSALRAHPWPGNVRELRAEVLRWTVFCDDVVDVADLTLTALGPGTPPGDIEFEPRASLPNGPWPTLKEAVAETERVLIARTLEREGGNFSRAARALGVDRGTLRRKLARV